MNQLLEIKNLAVEFSTPDAKIRAVNDVSLVIPKGQTVGLVGESGSGKSITALSILGLVPQPPGKIISGQINYLGRDLLKMKDRELRHVRGNKISMIFQEPMTSLNPVFKVGDQIGEALRLHKGLSRAQAWQRSVELLDQVGIPNAKERANSYPHELSGGQRQRVMIAMAISCEPDLLIADEPTTALDVTIQKQILELLADLKKKYQMSLLFITHDLGVVASIADQVAVMHRGQIVELNNKSDLFSHPKHSYTKGLLACRPSIKEDHYRLPVIEDGKVKMAGHAPAKKTPASQETLLEVRGLKKYFAGRSNFFGQVKNWIKAVDDVSLTVKKGQTLGLVGESGCGKTTLGRTILRLIEPTSGQIIYRGQDLVLLNSKDLRQMRRRIQIVFQDPYASLNPRMSIGSTLSEPMLIHNIGTSSADRRDRAAALLNRVGLSADMLSRYPHEFSGGQRQRICIARALAVEPEFIVCDESVSALDVSIQAQILNLLKDLQDDLGLTYVFVSHDLAVVKFMADQVAVMHQGKIVESQPTHQLFTNPQNDYTKKLLHSVLN